MGCSTGLIALGVGYLVLLKATKEKGGLKLLGQIIGVAIVVTSLLLGLCAAKCGMSGGHCALMGKMGYGMGGKMMCPVAGKGSMMEMPTESAEAQK